MRGYSITLLISSDSNNVDDSNDARYTRLITEDLLSGNDSQSNNDDDSVKESNKGHENAIGMSMIAATIVRGSDGGEKDS